MVLAHTPGAPEEHLQALEQVFQCLREAHLKLKVEKCVCFEPNLPSLGLIIDKNGIKSEPTKVKATQETRLPTTLTEVRQFSQLWGYYTNFMKRFSDIVVSDMLGL